jgi:hypothetical protein
VIVYHARSYRDIVGNPLFDHNRHGRVQPFFFRCDGTPVFGYPVGDGDVPVRLSNEHGQLLAITAVSVPQAATGADVIGETWRAPDTPLATQVIAEAEANADNLSVSRSLFRVLSLGGQDIELEPVLRRGAVVRVPAREWSIA